MNPTLFETLLRSLTLPLVAVTTSAGGRRNGMIANSAQRASLVPSIPRLSLYITKTNFTHDLVYSSGIFAVHLLYADQWPVIEKLGFRSGRDVGDKFEGLETRIGETGCPLLEGARAAFECRVVNTMDAGGATFFLGDIVQTHEGPEGPIMTSDHFRANVDHAARKTYLERLAAAQAALEPLSRHIDTSPWPGPSVGP